MALAIAGCTAKPDLWPEERLDPNTAVNVTIMAEPWIYSRDVPMLAANARDYLNVGLVETNRSGTRAYWLGIVAWSTIDRSVLPGQPAPLQPDKVRLVWADSKLEMPASSKGRSAVGLTDPVFIDAGTKFTEAWYPLSTAQLAQLTAAAPASVALLGDEEQLTTYQPWRVDPASMAEFLKATGL